MQTWINQGQVLTTSRHESTSTPSILVPPLCPTSSPNKSLTAGPILFLSLSYTRSQDSVVSKVTRLWTGQSRVRFSDFLFPKSPDRGLLPSGLCTKTLYALLVSPLHPTCPAHFMFYLITQTISGKQYRSWSSSSCSFLQSRHSLHVSSHPMFFP